MIQNAPLDIEAEVSGGENRITSIGRTNQGRFLVVVTTMRGIRLRVVTAFPAPKPMIDFYVVQNEG
ncbi:MAG: hypothetical protein JO307_02430 [Bryobacterales bacterium]|nr:hypothetical protein [Bryobacterales bacterium]MBV9398566.1 hypothetical protein [Bryobacterales bacterium]